jgi:hypothetical protein
MNGWNACVCGFFGTTTTKSKVDRWGLADGWLLAVNNAPADCLSVDSGCVHI